MKTLLTPAVIHESVLSTFPSRNKSFFIKYITAFGAVQGFIGILFTALYFVNVLLPIGLKLGQYADKALVAANFTTMTVAPHSFTSDIKPKIWTYTFDDSATAKTFMVVDADGSLNKAIWDDSLVNGVLKHRYGVGLLKDHFVLKYDTLPVSFPYSLIVGQKTVEFQKGDVYNKVQNFFSKKNLYILFFIALPFIFVFYMALGILAQILFSFVMGLLSVLIAQVQPTETNNAIKTASALYVPWAYAMALLISTQAFLSQSFIGSLPLFFGLIQVLFFVGILEIGIQQLRNKKVSVSKVAKKTV